MTDEQVVSTTGQWSFRFRFRARHPFGHDAPEAEFVLAGRKAVLRSRSGKALSLEEDVRIEMHDFQTEEDARAFGNDVRTALMAAEVERGSGIDPGNNLASTTFSSAFIAAFEADDKVMLADVHGLLVYQRTGREVPSPIIRAELSVRQPIELFFERANAVLAEDLTPDDTSLAALELMSLAGMSNEPLSKAVLHISAVEMLAPHRAWTGNEEKFFERIHDNVEADPFLTRDEQANVSKALKGIHQSVRQRIKALILHELELPQATWKTFDQIYSERSKIVHGAIEFDRNRHQALASKASEVCRTIVGAAIRRRPSAGRVSAGRGANGHRITD